MNPNELSRLSNEVATLRAWTQTHDKAHVTDDDRLNMILDTVTNHATNHHGPKSRVKLGAVLTLLSAVVMLVGELLRRFAL